MAVSEDAEAVLAAKFAVMRKVADERTWRVYLGSEARALGRGGIVVVARAAGVSETTVAAGVSEIDAGGLDELPPGRARRPGGGRKRAEDKDPGLRPALRGLAEAATRGDPVAEITWCSLSLRDLEREMAALGFRCGKDAIARMMREDGYSLQGMSRVLEGNQHPDRDAQFRHINEQIAAFGAAGDPVVSVDAKKKEQLGPFHRAGRTWRRAGDPVKVRDHDFPDEELGKITPYGVYDIAANRGFVSAGASRDTAAFAVNALRLWWQREGSSATRGHGGCWSPATPAVQRLPVPALERAAGRPGGGDRAGDHRVPLPARHVQVEQDRAPAVLPHHPHLAGTAAHDEEDAVAGIAATTTYAGLKVTAVLDEGSYPAKVKVGDERMRHLEDRVIARHGAHGEWNYAIRPARRPGTGAAGCAGAAP